MSKLTNPPIPIASAPWTTKCESYWMVVTLGRGLPEGVYDPLEASSPEFADPSTAGEFRGGIGVVVIVRYSETPVGPYDELFIIPGNFTVPGTKKERLRICRIYVNQRATMFNGRNNWNIPKHLARFNFENDPSSGALHVSVHPPAPDDSLPFFSCTMTPFKWIPAIPFSTKYLPLSTVLAQPPIPAAPPAATAGPGARYRGVGEEERALLVGTEFWREMPIHGSSPRARGMWIKIYRPGEKKVRGVGGAQGEELERIVADAKSWWPTDVRPWRMGLWMDDAELVIPKPVEWKL